MFCRTLSNIFTSNRTLCPSHRDVAYWQYTFPSAAWHPIFACRPRVRGEGSLLYKSFLRAIVWTSSRQRREYYERCVCSEVVLGHQC